MATNTTYRVRTDRHTNDEIENIIEPDLGAIICSSDTGTFYVGTEDEWSPISTADVAGLLEIEDELQALVAANLIPEEYILNGNFTQTITHNRGHKVKIHLFRTSGTVFYAPYRNIDDNTVRIYSLLPLTGTAIVE